MPTLPRDAGTAAYARDATFIDTQKKLPKQANALAKTGRTQIAVQLPSARGTQRTRHHNLIVLSFRYGSSSRTSPPLC
jgi:hypothetical protein